MSDSIVGKEYLPNVHIEKIIYQEFESYQKAMVTVTMYDYEDQTWSLDEKFTGYLNVSCIAVWKRSIIDQLSSSNIMLNELRTGEEQSVFKLKCNFDDLEKNNVMIRGITYKKFKKHFSFVIPITIINLSVYSASIIELQDLKDNENLDLSYTQVQSYMGSVSSEKIIENNSEMSTATIFYDQNESPWSGPVHRMPSGPYMAGSQHGITSEENLVSKTITNNKIEYLERQASLDLATYVGPSLQSSRPQVNLQSQVLAPNFSAALGRQPTGTLLVPQATLRNTLFNSNPQATLRSTLFNSNPQAPQRSTLFNPNPQATPYYQEEFVEDHARNVSNTTIVDLENILLSESPVAKIMYQMDRQALTSITQATNIINIEINRYPMLKSKSVNAFNLSFRTPDFSQPTLIARSNNNHQKVKNKVLYKVSPRKIISVDPKKIKIGSPNMVFDGKQITRDLIASSRKIGKIEQLDLTLPATLRPINFVDYNVRFAKAGSYKYQTKLSIKDEPLLYCQGLLKDLIRNARKLQNLYDVTIMKNVFNGDVFSTQYLYEFYSQYNIAVDPSTGFVEGEYNTPELLNSYLVKSFEVLLRAERLIGTRPRANRLVNSVNLFSTDLERILNTVNYYNSIIDRFKRTYSLSDGKSSEKASSKSRKDRGVIEKVITLKKEYKRELMKPIGINFISMNKSDGLPIINIDLFGQRANIEVKKYFPGVINKNNKALSFLPENLRSPMANIEENKFMNFSPAKIFFGQKEVDTTEINSESFDSDFFNTLRIVKSAIQNNESTQEQDDFDPASTSNDENLEKYIDSRDFLGDETKFNNAVINILLRKPMLIGKIRKKFKFLDNKILKASKKSISLKTFDLSQPNNIIVQKLKENPRQVPMQLKALSLLKTPMTTFDLDTIDFDPLSNPQTQEVFTQNYLNLGKVEVLEGFEMINGRLSMDRPIYKEIDAKMFNNLKDKNVLCRVVPRTFAGLTTNQETLNIHDKVFVMRSVNRVRTNKLPEEENG